MNQPLAVQIISKHTEKYQGYCDEDTDNELITNLSNAINEKEKEIHTLKRKLEELDNNYKKKVVVMHNMFSSIDGYENGNFLLKTPLHKAVEFETELYLNEHDFQKLANTSDFENLLNETIDKIEQESLKEVQ
jgi:uncharacterized protein YihD (DUF1040 family)